MMYEPHGFKYTQIWLRKKNLATISTHSKYLIKADVFKFDSNYIIFHGSKIVHVCKTYVIMGLLRPDKFKLLVFSTNWWLIDNLRCIKWCICRKTWVENCRWSASIPIESTCTKTHYGNWYSVGVKNSAGVRDRWHPHPDTNLRQHMRIIKILFSGLMAFYLLWQQHSKHRLSCNISSDIFVWHSRRSEHKSYIFICVHR